MKNMFPVICLCLLVLYTALSASAQPRDIRTLLTVEENDYWRFVEGQWSRLADAERIINGPMAARSLAGMNSQATAITRKAAGILHAVFDSLKQRTPPPLFAAYHRHFSGFVDSVRSLTASYEPVAATINDDLHNAFVRSRGDQYAFARIAGCGVEKTVSKWRPPARRHVRNIAFFHERMTTALGAINDTLSSRAPPDTAAPANRLGDNARSMIFAPFFLPVLIQITDQGVVFSLSKTLATPVGSVPVTPR